MNTYKISFFLFWPCFTTGKVTWFPERLTFVHPRANHHLLCHQHHYSGSSVHNIPPINLRKFNLVAHKPCQLLSARSHDNVLQPPEAYRNKSSFVLAGDTKTNKTLLQSLSSPHRLLSRPRVIPDPYGWLRDDSRTNETVLAHLRAENEYTRYMTKHLAPLEEGLYQEFLSYTCETDYTPPIAFGKYWYYERWQEGVSYPRYCRAPRNFDDANPPEVNDNWNEPGNTDSMQPLLYGEEIYLDVPSIANNKTYFALGAIAVSPNQEYVAFSLDETGNEDCHFHVRHIASGDDWILHDDYKRAILKGYGAIEWDNECKGIFYIKTDETQRPSKVYYRRLFHANGNTTRCPESIDDVLLFEEPDESFNLHITKTFDMKYLLVISSSTESSEIHYLDLQCGFSGGPKADRLQCISSRREKVIYRVAHCKGYWLVMTNMGHLSNLGLKSCRVGVECSMEKWSDVVLSSTRHSIFDGGDERSLDYLTVFYPSQAVLDANPNLFAYGVATGREAGLPRVWVLEISKIATVDASEPSPIQLGKFTRLEFDEPVFDVSIGSNRDPTLPYVVIKYDSLVTPLSHIAVPLHNPNDLTTRIILKKCQVPNYEQGQYSSERITIKSRDQRTEIPVSFVYRSDALLSGDGNIPLHLYGYGSYGASIEASFRNTRLPLLNRGVVCAIAHVRGGGENGRQWYEGAKYLKKQNSFNDFVDVARFLARAHTSKPRSFGEGMTNPMKLAIEGRSAGGLLLAASMNQEPSLFHAAILEVPFVDVLCTMKDSSLPLTAIEWEEWGNPNEQEYFEYIKRYSPINNIGYEKVYPACLLTAGLHDSRVQFWEVAKFASELRHSASKNSGKVLLKIDMNAGHFAGQDRYKHYRELSLKYSFLLDQLKLT